MLEMAKKISASQGSQMLVLDTLNPELNKFYEKHGAAVVCESQLLRHPTTLMRIGH